MCGIAGFTVREPGSMDRLGYLANELLRQIEPRGRDAAGLLALTDGSVHLEKRTVTASRFVRSRKPFPDNANTVLLHARYATVGSRFDPKCAHPVASGKVAAVHNGTIWNDAELFEEIGRKRFADVDSEAIAAVIDWADWDGLIDVVGLLLGGAAVAAIHTDHRRDVALFRTTGFPLVYMVTDDIIVWASTAHAIRNAWKYAYRKVRMGEFYDVPDWSVHRVTDAQVVSRERVTPDPNAPGMERNRRPVIVRPNVKKSRRPMRLATPAPTITGVRVSDDDRTWARDLETEWEQMRLDNTSGSWSADGAYAFDGDADPLDRQASIFEMTDAEFYAWCETQGFTGDDDD